MQQTYAKALAGMFVSAIVALAATYFGTTFGPEITSSLEVILTYGIGMVLAAVTGFFTVQQVSNAPAGGVVTVIPETVAKAVVTSPGSEVVASETVRAVANSVRKSA